MERLHHRVGTKLYMPPELLDPDSSFHFNRINAYQQGDMYSLALVLWEIGNCACTVKHIRPYENQLSVNFTVDQLIELVCVGRKRPISCEATSEKVRKERGGNSNICLLEIDSPHVLQFTRLLLVSRSLCTSVCGESARSTATITSHSSLILFFLCACCNR